MGRFSCFVLGGIVGAGIALFFTPRTGEQNRALVSERANALAGDAKGLADVMPENFQDTYRTAVDQGVNLVNSAMEKSVGFVNDATAKVKEVTNSVQNEANSEELRDKIEAARQRIASQVMENAEQSKAAAAKVTEVAASAIDSAGAKFDNVANALEQTAKEIAD